MKTTIDQVIDELDAGRSFLVEAGAGAGKTTTLVQALEHSLQHHGAELASKGRRIACITFTNVAKRKITERIHDHPLVTVATIHEFLWEVIKGFGGELWQQITEYNDALPTPEDLSELTSPPTPIQYVDWRRRLHRGEISHDEVIDLALRMVTRYPKLTRLIADCYPVIFVDEYQDTSPKTIRLLLDHLAGAGRQPCVIGLFGDSMQKIFTSGQGAVTHPKLEPITKHENYRCSRPVVEVLNKIRPQLRQEAVGENTDGEVHLFLNSALPAGQARLAAARQHLAGLGWSDDTTSYLMLTHRGIAGALSYGTLLHQYQILGSQGRDKLLDNDEPYIEYLSRVEALCSAFHTLDYAELTSLLVAGRTTITSHRDKRRIAADIRELIAVRESGTIGAVLDHMARQHLLSVPRKLSDLERRRTSEDLEGYDQKLADFSNALRKVPYAEVIRFIEYREQRTPFHTQHGVKGDEFDNVIVIIDDASWTQYNMGKMLAGRDIEKRLERSRNLFYVSCSRARRGLAVVFLADIPDGALPTAHDWFASGTVHP
ncbi:UvrD-helicase domain-containing protein [Streptomyces sp. NBC_00878]|uniref:UvrD-helicase domain-containing protein n=1 Tax=Streptomyces sp. NBC_00878 TaxID=2975854 RepID=UPI002257D464|nr:ATP-dependent helicase [Streptomyces sp. NBC_00878]MCX4909603.1 ATP-dependent helicase [Streptomyces sp. NBC_00878]